MESTQSLVCHSGAFPAGPENIVLANFKSIRILASVNEVLKQLFVSECDLASEALTRTLQGLIQIGKESGRIIPTAAFAHLDRNSKILVFLLGLRAASMLTVGAKSEATSEEIAAAVGFDAKSVGEYASRLKQTYLSRGSKGYTIAPEKICLVCDHIQTARTTRKEKR